MVSCLKWLKQRNINDNISQMKPVIVKERNLLYFYSTVQEVKMKHLYWSGINIHVQRTTGLEISRERPFRLRRGYARSKSREWTSVLV